MYLNQVEIVNIRSIKNFMMEITEYAGWHVIIGDNGTGKSTIVRSIALTLVGPEQALGLRASWNDWLKNDALEGRIHAHIDPSSIDKVTGRGAKIKNYYIPNFITFARKEDGLVSLSSNAKSSGTKNPLRNNWGDGYGWFSTAYGPFRRFGGGSPEWTKVFFSLPKLGAHLSVFGEDVALTEATEWLIKLQYQTLENKDTGNIIHDIKKLINSPNFLPHKAELESVSSAGVIFKDGNGLLINVNQMSDGYRSILSLTFELIRQLDRVYGTTETFKEIRKGNMIIDLPGIVLIDEIDAHLHPSWQTRIGKWFTQYFPKIQFIVTTHSPLVCRACEKGTIWRLAAPESNIKSGEVLGVERERLIYGNVLDAFGTEAFGKDAVRSKKSDAKLDRLGKLNMLYALNKITAKEEKERLQLQKTLSTDDPTGF